jgi:hypothetical protein
MRPPAVVPDVANEEGNPPAPQNRSRASRCNWFDLETLLLLSTLNGSLLLVAVCAMEAAPLLITFSAINVGISGYGLLKNRTLSQRRTAPPEESQISSDFSPT